MCCWYCSRCGGWACTTVFRAVCTSLTVRALAIPAIRGWSGADHTLTLTDRRIHQIAVVTHSSTQHRIQRRCVSIHALLEESTAVLRIAHHSNVILPTSGRNGLCGGLCRWLCRWTARTTVFGTAAAALVDSTHAISTRSRNGGRT